MSFLELMDFSNVLDIGKVYNNDDITFFSCVLTFAQALVNNTLQPSPLCGSGCNTLSHSGLANIKTQKGMFYPLIINNQPTLRNSNKITCETNKLRSSSLRLTKMYLIYNNCVFSQLEIGEKLFSTDVPT